MVQDTLVLTSDDSILRSLIEKEIPDGRKKLLQNHQNLAELSHYCKKNYFDSSDKTKAFNEVKGYASQSLASVAYQIHSLAMNIQQMFDQQFLQLKNLQSNVNNIGLLVDIHKEKIARRDIGIYTGSKNFSKSHKIVPPPHPEKVRKYKRQEIDYSILDDIGHGVKLNYKDDIIQNRNSSTSSLGGSVKSIKESSMSSIHSSSQGSSYGIQPSRHLFPSSDKKLAFGSTLPPPPRPPVAPVAPGRKRFPSVESRDPEGKSNEEIYSTLTEHISSQDIINDTAEVTNFPLPPPLLPPPDPPSSSEDAYQMPTNNMLDEEFLPAPPDSAYCETLQSNENLYEIVPSPPLPIPQIGDLSQFNEEKVIAIYDYEKLRDDELELIEGDVIYVIKRNEDGWFEGIKDGVQGLFPGNYVISV